VLSASCLDSLSDSSQVRARASEIVAFLSGACHILLGVESHIQAGTITEILPDGGRSILRVEAAFRTRAVSPSVRAGDKISHPADKTRDWLRQARTDPEVAHGLLLWSCGSEWWILFKIFEIVEKSSGGVKGIKDKGWATKKQCDRFTRMVNSRTALGLNARHAFDQSTPPDKPMKKTEAFNLVACIYQKWAAERAERNQQAAR
jgi:hypothetical protein